MDSHEKHALFTLPNVPSAISSTTLYSPSFEGEKTSTGSLSDISGVVLLAIAATAEVGDTKEYMEGGGQRC